MSGSAQGRGPSAPVIPRETEAPANARTQSWFNATYLEAKGWSAAWLADSDGGCEWTDAD